MRSRNMTANNLWQAVQALEEEPKTAEDHVKPDSRLESRVRLGDSEKKKEEKNNHPDNSASLYMRL
jgi:hypothetical protein